MPAAIAMWSQRTHYSNRYSNAARTVALMDRRQRTPPPFDLRKPYPDERRRTPRV